MNFPIRLSVVAAFICCLFATFPAYASSSYPSRPIKVLVGFRAGGSVDTMARILAKHMRGQLNEPLVIENRAGGGGALAAAEVRRARPDGYTVGMMILTTTTLDPLLRHTGLKPSDFDYVSAVAKGPLLMVAAKDAPFSTLPGMIKYAQQKGGALNYASLIPLDKLIMRYIGKRNGVTFRPVPTKGGAGVMQSILGGVTDFGWSSGLYKQYLKSGQIKVIATSTSEREKGAPNAPTLKELGYDIAVDNYVILVAPKGTPKADVDKLASAVKSAMSDKDFHTLVYKHLAMGSPYIGPEKLTGIINQSESTFKRLIKEAK